AAAPSARASRQAAPVQNAAPQQNVAPQQRGVQQNQAARAAPQQSGAAQQGVIPQNQVTRAVPPSATRARAASDPRAFSGGVLRNQAFAGLAATRDPSARTLQRRPSRAASSIRN